MKIFLPYLLEMMLVSGVCCLCYWFTKNHTTPLFRRYFLIVGLVASFTFPLLKIPSPAAVPVQLDQMVSYEANPLFDQPATMDGIDQMDERFNNENKKSIKAGAPATSIDWPVIAATGYAVIALFFLIRIVLGIVQINVLRKEATLRTHNGGYYYEVDQPEFRGASFFNWIFIGKNVSAEKDIVLKHESIHKRLYHSLDILFSHLYTALFWINPFGWILRKMIRINTELQADQYYTGGGNYQDYAETLIALSQRKTHVAMMNHFSARHLKTRLIAMAHPVIHRRWVSYVAGLTTLMVFFLVSCDAIENTSEVIIDERLNDIKTITTRFTSHQSDTQQKTGKIVSIATFLPDGTLDEFVTQTTYPYDNEFETKKEFWDEPIRKNLFYIMDGLSMGSAEKSLLYGNDWPKAYAKYLKKVEAGEMNRNRPYEEKITVDNMDKPTEILHEKVPGESIMFFGNANITEFFVYDGNKVIETAHMNTYPEIDENDERYQKTIKFNNKDVKIIEIMKQDKEDEGVRKVGSVYEYDGDLLTSMKYGDNYGRYEYKFFYENNVLTKSEYYKNDGLISTRFHYYKNGLKDRTEIFNIYNEPEYTINYTYEYWD